ncbi:PRP40 pre-mRNA processing factor 40, partial [Thoreauomyces humboldtii]
MLTRARRIQKALANSCWKEFEAPGGKKYYYNSETKVTTWEIPADLKAVMQVATAPVIPAALPAPNHPQANTVAVYSREDADREKEQKEQRDRDHQRLNFTPAADPYLNVQTEFDTREDAEEAFMGMLRETNVTPDWTWETTMRIIISHPLYRALKTLSERRSAFERYIDEKRKEAADIRKAKYDEDRVVLRTLFTDPQHGVNSRTRYRKAASTLENNEVFKAIDDHDRQAIFREFVEGLQEREKEIIRETRKDNVTKFERILQRLTAEELLTIATTWAAVQELYKAQPEYRADRKLQAMEPIDFLLTFEHHIQDLVTKYRQGRDEKRRARHRQERIKRDQFRAFLLELAANDTVHARTHWLELFPAIHDDERYIQLLNQPGSDPLELFGDVIVQMIDEFRPTRRAVEDIVKASNIPISLTTTLEEIKKSVSAVSEGKFTTVKPTIIRLVYEE